MGVSGARLLKPIFIKDVSKIKVRVFAYRVFLIYQEVLQCLCIRKRLYCLLQTI